MAGFVSFAAAVSLSGSAAVCEMHRPPPSIRVFVTVLTLRARCTTLSLRTYTYQGTQHTKPTQSLCPVLHSMRYEGQLSPRTRDSHQ